MGFDLPTSGAPPRRRAPAPVPVLVLVFCVVACGGGDSDDSRGGLSPSAASSSVDSLVAAPVPASGEALAPGPGDEALVGGDAPPSEASAGPPELYYELTAFDWFLRGEPLVHAGGRYEAAGPPIPMRASELRLLDRYEGVDFYAREGASEGDTVFVPVSERYWLAFTRRSPDPGPAAAADVPPDSVP